jgi:hypothetical protein
LAHSLSAYLLSVIVGNANNRGQTTIIS